MPFLGKTPTKLLDANVNIDGGNIDGTTIGAASTAPATVSTFTSTGIDDNATSTAITIDASQKATFSNSVEATIAYRAYDSVGAVYRNVLRYDSGDVRLETGSAGSEAIKMYTGGTERMRIDSSGSVHIGPASNDSQGYTIDLSPDLQQTAGIDVNKSSPNVNLDLYAGGSSTNLGGWSGQIRFFTGGSSQEGTERMRIDSSGNLLVGTTDGNFVNGVGLKIANATSARLKLCDSTHGVGASNGFEFTAAGLDGYIYNNENGATIFGTNASERMRINSTGSLILTGGGGTVTDTHGTASRTNLQLDGSSETIVTFSQSGTTRGYLNAASNSFDLVAGTGSKLRLLSNGSGSTAVTLDTSGNVGIGTASAGNLLHIHEGSSAGAWAQFTNTTTSAGGSSGVLVGLDSNEDFRVLQYESKAVAFYTSATERMRINSSGSVGIGTTSPGTTLTVNADPPSATYGIANFTAPVGNDAYIVVNRGSADNGGIKVQRGSNVDGAFYVTGGEAVAIGYNMSDTGDSLVFRNGSSNAEVARMDNSGNLLVGRSSTAGSATDYGAQIYNTGVIYLFANASGNDDIFRGHNSAGTNTSAIEADGNYIDLSDERAKENITDAPDALSLIGNMQVRSFDWIGRDQHQTYGFVAQELKSTFEEAVRVPDDEEAMWGVRHSKIIPVLTKAIQEQQAMIETLQAQVAELQGA